MTTFLLIPGAGGMPWYWRLVTPLLEAAGHEAVAVDLPADDPAAGLPEYADVVVAAARGHDDIALVAASLGGFTAPLVTARIGVRTVVFLNAMIPLPGETPGEWGDATGSSKARAEADAAAGRDGGWDETVYFLHDVPGEVLSTSPPPREEADIVFGQRCDFTAWPDVPLHVLVGRDDRMFPAAFQQRVARGRLGVEADVIPGGHLLPLANPVGVTASLVSYLN